MPSTPASASKPRPGKTGLDTFAREELMASLSLSGSSSGSRATHGARASLGTLPFEIKQWIVYWLNQSEEEDPLFDSDDSDVEEVDDDEFTDKPRKPIPKPTPTRTQISNLFKFPPSKPAPSHPAPPDSTTLSPPISLKSILSLSLVDRTFYEICRPFIWQTLDLENFDLSKLKELRTGALTRQAEYVRRIWWRVTISELDEYEPDSWMSALEGDSSEGAKKEWDEWGRSSELLEMLTMCTRITNLDVDLRPASLDEHRQFIPQPLEPTAKFLAPISQLSHLTSIALTAPSNGNPFSEVFLVRLIQDMVHLQCFRCCAIEAHAPDFELSNSISVCESPLALHLSRLVSLKEIDLDQADCFDLSWSTIEWAGTLEDLALDDCCRASLRALHAFCRKFSGTLSNLEVTDVPYDEEVFRTGEAQRTITELGTGMYRFELPVLTTLSVSNELPIVFLENFAECKKIRLLELAVNPSISAADIERLVNPDSWPRLQKVIIATADSDLSQGQLEALELFFLSKGVLLDIDDDQDSDDSDDDDDNSNDDEQIGYAFDDDLDDLQNEWMDDDEDFED
ncbi:hypothetical protein PCASD_11533 [Puccinia coronata f. sp. avenae]|uniref:F-box domain-containing protein n=1 Tax=Puccinia coronata f. sp. avenae TaxID=200324 RepID=A0A2N5TKM6_9BASI|nr:hypothetical protein PCASD_24740 [Puccinia coronata f. sp. avenae]PLW38712.1 hypothetical protein PCASD_11533 [Puccinia coronata f. sp. avenae]